MDQDSSRWGSIAVGLLGIATVLLGATAVGAFEVSTEFGIGRNHELNSVGRKVLEVLLYGSVFSYMSAWAFALAVMNRGPGWRKQNTFWIAVCVFLQSLCIAVAALAIVHVSFSTYTCACQTLSV